jgi:hypothetical protein
MRYSYISGFGHLTIQGVSTKCTLFQIKISHNLLNIRCSAVSWPILYLMRTWIMLNLNMFLWVVYLFIYPKFPETCVFTHWLIREIIRLSKYYNRFRLIWIWKGVHLIHPVVYIKIWWSGIPENFKATKQKIFVWCWTSVPHRAQILCLVNFIKYYSAWLHVSS